MRLRTLKNSGNWEIAYWSIGVLFSTMQIRFR